MCSDPIASSISWLRDRFGSGMGSKKTWQCLRAGACLARLCKLSIVVVSGALDDAPDTFGSRQWRVAAREEDGVFIFWSTI